MDGVTKHGLNVTVKDPDSPNEKAIERQKEAHASEVSVFGLLAKALLLNAWFGSCKNWAQHCNIDA